MNSPELQSLCERDEVLCDIISNLDLPAIESTGDVFHDLMSCIIEQQIHYRSTKQIFQNMLDAASLVRLSPDNFDQFEEAAFSPTSLSAAKYETILRILEFQQQNTIDWAALPDTEVRDILRQIKGIGPWTIDMVLLYTLGRPDVFPAEDYHLKQIMVRLYGLDPKTKLKARMTDIGRKWKPNRSLATRYLLAWKERNR
jgi:DNA-3-methyladenine glycosylase II